MRRILATMGLVCATFVVASGVASAQDLDPVPTSTAPTGAAAEPSTSVVPSTTETPAAIDAPVVVESVPTTTAPTTVAAAPAAPTASPASAPEVTVAAAQQCDPNYPNICLTPGVEVDCIDIPEYGNFVVLPGDPFGLDDDGDGFGCEANTTGVSADGGIPATTAPTTTTPVAVAGATAAPTTTLPVTGTASTLLAVLGFVVLAIGFGLIMTRDHLANPFTGRLRGGFTVTTVNRHGEVVSYRVTSRT